MSSSKITIPEIPEGFTLHTENNSHILLSSNEAFLNPVQEFNRDTSVACIRVWSEEQHELKKAKWLRAQEKKQTKQKKRKRELVGFLCGFTVGLNLSLAVDESADISEAAPAAASTEPREYSHSKFVILEALSATGLRSIRYAKEIPHVSHILANDLSPAATAAMRRNIEINGLSPRAPPSETEAAPGPSTRPVEIKVNEGDACTLMYNHRDANKRVDVVDLDPYGSAAPFIDAAVQCIKDGGLLCVTCTDLAVLATTNYAEKCFSNYGGVPIKSEYSHEAALRLVLHAVSTSAARYGRYIEPLVSLSIDFYVRLFMRVATSPMQAKKGHNSFYGQPLGKLVETVHGKSVNYNFKLQGGPPVMDKCPECDSVMHMAGPMWSAPIHNPEFVAKVLDHVENNESQYGTAVRMKGMLTVAKEELPDTPFYFTPSKVSKHFHCVTPSFSDMASALLHGGHKISRSHASAGSIKTTATNAELFDIYRSWIKLHPVKMANISPTSPAQVMLARENKVEANFDIHPDTQKYTSRIKLVRYQENPAPNWGPATKAVSGTGPAKRKHAEVVAEMDEDE
ncbi:tRNA (guanine(26)-N(2))-dimethyltransferase [Mycena sanguinolenta]|uniref:tRNA (guanine(26)-N(2))-dimethyltransferase n=1 Tax=Mycena sanguinolenta TaxID=230812 RepID=A0A8H7D6S3_9AGAR|nr:tRNA (guanine(26)-N(2))-dimethyltransferase [Mycena sanguinolenta]